MSLPLSLVYPGDTASSGAITPPLPGNNLYASVHSNKIVLIDPTNGNLVEKPHSIVGANNMAYSPKHNRLVIASNITLGSSGAIWYSDDLGTTWTQCPSNPNWIYNRGWLYVIYNPVSEMFFALSWQFAPNAIATSPDGINWTQGGAGGTSVGEIIATYNSMDIDVATGTLIVGLYVNGARNLQRSTTPLMNAWQRIPAAGDAGPAVCSVRSLGDSKWFTYGGSIAGSGIMGSSNDGVNFTAGTPPATTDAPQNASQFGGRAYIAHTQGILYSSADPLTLPFTTTGAVGDNVGALVGDKYNARTMLIRNNGEVRILTDQSYPAAIATIVNPGTIGKGCWI